METFTLSMLLMTKAVHAAATILVLVGIAAKAFLEASGATSESLGLARTL